MCVFVVNTVVYSGPYMWSDNISTVCLLPRPSSCPYTCTHNYCSYRMLSSTDQLYKTQFDRRIFHRVALRRSCIGDCRVDTLETIKTLMQPCAHQLTIKTVALTLIQRLKVVRVAARSGVAERLTLTCDRIEVVACGEAETATTACIALHDACGGCKRRGYLQCITVTTYLCLDNTVPAPCIHYPSIYNCTSQYTGHLWSRRLRRSCPPDTSSTHHS